MLYGEVFAGKNFFNMWDKFFNNNVFFKMILIRHAVTILIKGNVLQVSFAALIDVIYVDWFFFGFVVVVFASTWAKSKVIE